MGVVIKLLTLMRLTANQPIVDPATGLPTPAFQTLQNNRAANEETIVNNIVSALDQAGIATSSASDATTVASAAQSVAQTANGNASNALATAGSVARLQALMGSFITPGVLSATNTGLINVAAHTRYYANGASVSVNAGSISGLALAMTYFVFYDDAGRTGGAVSYQATTNMTAAAQIGDRHVIGVVTTPVANGAVTTGRTVLAPGIPS